MLGFDADDCQGTDTHYMSMAISNDGMVQTELLCMLFAKHRQGNVPRQLDSQPFSVGVIDI